ncbi:hypothetical protein [Microcoleus sp. CAWBG640]|uniref:hypothetical protein n=1 Tax=Microcoleus sp. CAWBG640 TaxID=2841653 RepID=UPI00312BAAFE
MLRLSDVTFVSADNELNAAAAREGLIVENPNNYPNCDRPSHPQKAIATRENNSYRIVK